MTLLYRCTLYNKQKLKKNQINVDRKPPMIYLIEKEKQEQRKNKKKEKKKLERNI